MCLDTNVKCCKCIQSQSQDARDEMSDEEMRSLLKSLRRFCLPITMKQKLMKHKFSALSGQVSLWLEFVRPRSSSDSKHYMCRVDSWVTGSGLIRALKYNILQDLNQELCLNMGHHLKNTLWPQGWHFLQPNKVLDCFSFQWQARICCSRLRDFFNWNITHETFFTLLWHPGLFGSVLSGHVGLCDG